MWECFHGSIFTRTSPYVGGGFGAEGVHNVLEAAVYGKPVLFGPEYEKFPEAAGLVDCGGGISIENALELEKTINEFWQNESLLKQSGASARQFVYSNAGSHQQNHPITFRRTAF
jgi:3-deoxy-D-manno-octulosonic-acid transferase